LVPSITGRGEPDPPGEQKGLACARALQGRVLTYAMAFDLTHDRRYRDAAVAELRHAIDDWRIWVDTAHSSDGRTALPTSSGSRTVLPLRGAIATAGPKMP